MNEGGSGTYTVALDTQPIADVGIAVLSNGVTVQPTSLTFTSDNWQTPQTVTVSAGQDEDTADEVGIINHGVDAAPESAYASVAIAGVIVNVADDDSDRAILESFYQATGAANWSNNANWLSNRPLGEWHGVTVNGRGQVTQLNLRDNNLGGSLPAELGNLSNLSIIGLARNSLSGSLPDSLGNLSGLTKLSLHDNTGLSGALPSGFTSLSNLQRLAIANTGLCAPDDEAFSDWLDTVPDKPGGVDTCE